MRFIFPKMLISYGINLVIILLVAGFIISRFTENIILLVAIFIMLFVGIGILFYRLYISYIRPIEKATGTIEKIKDGNYQARFHANGNKTLLNLSDNINKLARNLSDFSLQEQIQSEQLSTLIDNTGSGLVLLDEKGYIHLVNPTFINLFGKTEKDYVGSLYYSVLKNESLHKTIQKVFLYEKSFKQSFKLYPGIEKLYIEVSAVPIINERNMLKGAVLVFHDITELKKLENMRKDFVANVSHELRTPITSIKGFSETLLDGDMQDTAVQTEFLQIIYNESNRLQLIIEDLLALSYLEADNFQLVLHKVNVKELIKDILPTLSYKADERQIILTTAIENIEIKADKERLSQVIFNLVDNALNYTPADGKISLIIEQLDTHVCIIVSDTGIGISEKDQPRIFERFYRVDKARTRDSGGTGLGLAIVKHIVEVHHGDIEIESTVNEGTTITVYLPN